MKLVIDLEQDSYDAIEENMESVVLLLDYVTTQVRNGYTSSYEPSWEIIEDNKEDSLVWIKLARDQLRSGGHLSEEDMEKVIKAVDEIEELRERMIKERKAK